VLQRSLGLGLALLLGLCASLPPRRARAHGGLPISRQLLFDGQGGTLVSVSFWGLWVGRAGQPWRWICEEAINDFRARHYLRGGDGTLYVTDRLGLMRSTDGGCTFAPVGGELSSRSISQLVADPVEPQTLWASTGESIADDASLRIEGALWVSRDRGQSFARVLTLPRLIQSVAVSSSAPSVIYLASVDGQSADPSLHRSTDGGATFVDLPVTVTPEGEPLRALRLLAIDPRSPDVLYLRGQSSVTTDAGVVTRQSLLRSTDGGATHLSLLSVDTQPSTVGAPSGIDGVAIDGVRGFVYVATTRGLFAATDGAGGTAPGAALALEPRGGLSVARCVEVDPSTGTVWVCSSNYAPDFAAVASAGPGATAFNSALLYDQTVGVIGCAASTPVGAICPQIFTTYADQLGIGPDRVDGGTTPTPQPGSGCGCAIGGASSQRGSASPLWLLAALGLVHRGRRRAGRRG
jgi:hypothetical protein